MATRKTDTETIYCVKYASQEKPTRALIGTAPALSRAIDVVLADLWIWTRHWTATGEKGVRRDMNRARNKGHRFRDLFCSPLQMEGGPEELGRLYARFSHLLVAPGCLSYELEPELSDYIDRHFSAWTGEHARELQAAPPKMSHEDREAPVTVGLAGRLKRRPG